MKKNKNENYELDAIFEQRKYAAALEIAREYYNRCETDYARKTLEAIFPELAESEDERVRKELYAVVNDLVLPDEQRARFNAWLEKQKEPKSTIPSRNEIMGIWELGNIWKDCPEEREGLTQLHFIQKHWYDKNDYNSEEPKEKQKEQESTELRDSRQIALMIENGRRSGVIEGQKQVVYNPEEYGLCKPAEWSEEDMKVLDSIIDDYKKANKSFCGYDGKIALLNAIRDGKYNLPKQEWSEEDERMLVGIIERGSSQIPSHEPALRGEQMEWLMNRLKSLRPQPRQEWSEEDKRMIEEVDETLFMSESGVHETVKKLIEGERQWLNELPSRFKSLPRVAISEEALREGIGHYGITQHQIDNWLKKYITIV